MTSSTCTGKRRYLEALLNSTFFLAIVTTTNNVACRGGAPHTAGWGSCPTYCRTGALTTTLFFLKDGSQAAWLEQRRLVSNGAVTFVGLLDYFWLINVNH